MERLLRNFFLFLSKNKLLTRLAKKYGLRFGAARFVAGVDIESAAEQIKQLNTEGLVVTIDHLGEFIDNEAEAIQSTNECIKAIEVIKRENLNAELSLKMTSIGLDISESIVLGNMRSILEAGKEHGVVVTIDMEDYERCGQTLSIFKTLKDIYPSVGTVIQAYLYRSEKDIEELKAYAPYLRLVKGAYKESAEVAFPLKSDVDDNYKLLIKQNLLMGNYTAIATHDEAIIEYTKQLEETHQISRKQFEFQMLYGIRSERQKELQAEGYTMRVYVPYGADWYGYNMRRLAERPANIWFVLKSLFKR